jgi:hypothetical protein
MPSIAVFLVLTAIALTSLAIVPATAQSVEVRVTPPEPGYVEEGATFCVTIDVDDVTDFNSGQFDLSFDSGVVEVTDVTDGSINGETIPIFMWGFVDADTVRVSVYMPIGVGVSGSGHLAEVCFKVKGEEGDRSVLDISNGLLFDNIDIRIEEFRIDKEFKDELNDEKISDELKEIFSGKGCLLENPTVKVIQKDEKWKIIDKRVYVVTVGYFDLKVIDTGEILAKWIDAEIRVGEEEEPLVFDTGSGTYPGIFGRHEGTIEVYEDITVENIYTYPCSGTGGHSEYVKIWDATWEGVEAHWGGYTGDYHNLTFDSTFTLKAGEIYNYTIRTGSYPQIHHTDELEVDSGAIRCTKFTDANGKVYEDGFPAIKLW